MEFTPRHLTARHPNQHAKPSRFFQKAPCSEHASLAVPVQVITEKRILARLQWRAWGYGDVRPQTGVSQ